MKWILYPILLLLVIWLVAIFPWLLILMAIGVVLNIIDNNV